MPSGTKGPIEEDNVDLKALAGQIELARLLPTGSEPHRLAQALSDLPSLPDRFNAAFLEHGWVYVEFACGHAEAEKALTMLLQGDSQEGIDEFLAGSLLGIEPIKWQSLALLGGGIAEPKYPQRAAVVERVFEAYGAGDFLIAVPLILMLVDGFGVTITGTKSMFADLEALEDLFQSSESVAGHPSALKALLVRLRKGQRGYSEQPLTMPLRNGILHGTRLNYANQVVAAKAINLLAAVVEWARDQQAEPKTEADKRAWNLKFLSANLSRLNPHSPDQALDLFQTALTKKRAGDLVSLTNYHPTITLLSGKLTEWVAFSDLDINIEKLASWEIFGTADDSAQYASCNARLSVTAADATSISREITLRASRSVELARAGLPSVWQIDLGTMGSINRMISDMGRL